MKENEVFWLGRRSRAGGERELFADEPEFVAAMQDACAGHGCEIQRFVSARGPYGTWLVEFRRDGKNQRIVWNGKDEILVLQVELIGGGWEESHATQVAQIDVSGFVDGVNRLFGAGSESHE